MKPNTISGAPLAQYQEVYCGTFLCMSFCLQQMQDLDTMVIVLSLFVTFAFITTDSGPSHAVLCMRLVSTDWFAYEGSTEQA